MSKANLQYTEKDLREKIVHEVLGEKKIHYSIGKK